MRLIDADKLERVFIGKHYGVNAIKYFIKIQHTVDAAPVKHGRWEYIPGDGKFRAILIRSKCKKCVVEYDRFDYCPHCGAKMDGGIDHGKEIGS